MTRPFLGVSLLISSAGSQSAVDVYVNGGAWSSPQQQPQSLAYPQRLLGIDAARLALYSSVAGGAYLRCNRNTTAVPPTRVNDNYCDCAEDGLDEPSTSACAHVPTPPSFWCENGGLTPAFIPTSRVGDGVCDCCDGADEQGHSSRISILI